MKRQHEHHASQALADFLRGVSFAFVAVNWNRLVIAVLVVNVDLGEAFSEPDHFKIQI